MEVGVRERAAIVVEAAPDVASCRSRLQSKNDSARVETNGQPDEGDGGGDGGSGEQPG